MPAALDHARADAAIGEMTRRIVEHMQPERIILFGSFARGTAGPDSDADLLVIMQHVESRRKAIVAIHRLLADIGFPKDVIVATLEDVEAYGDTVGTILRPALREGRVLYERG